jgi:hypothetical protein
LPKIVLASAKLTMPEHDLLDQQAWRKQRQKMAKQLNTE